MRMSPTSRNVSPSMRAELLLRRVEVGQDLGRVLAPAVAAVDHRHRRPLGRLGRRALLEVAHRDDVAVVLEHVDRVLDRLLVEVAGAGHLRVGEARGRGRRAGASRPRSRAACGCSAGRRPSAASCRQAGRCCAGSRAIGASSSQTSKTRSNSARSKSLSDRMSLPRKLLIVGSSLVVAVDAPVNSTATRSSSRDARRLRAARAARPGRPSRWGRRRSPSPRARARWPRRACSSSTTTGVPPVASIPSTTASQS